MLIATLGWVNFPRKSWVSFKCKSTAIRVTANTQDDSELECCAVRNLDGSFAVIIMNRTEQAKKAAVGVHSHISRVNLEPHSICTLLLGSERQ